MAELQPTQGDNTPPPLIPRPMGYLGLGDQYGGTPGIVLPPLDPTPNPDWLGVLGQLGGAAQYPFELAGQVLDAAGHSGVPALRGASKVAQTAMGAFTLPGGALSLASGEPNAQRAFQDNSKTLGDKKTPGGNQAGPFDVGALYRGLTAANAASTSALGSVAQDPNASTGQRIAGAVGNVGLNLLPLAVGGVAKPGSAAARDVARRVAENPAVQRFVTEDAGLGRVNPFSGMSDEELIAKSKTAAPAEVKAVQDELGNRINAMGGNPVDASIAKSAPTGRSTIVDTQLGDTVNNPGPYGGEWKVVGQTTSKGKVGASAGQDIISGITIKSLKTGRTVELGGFSSMDIVSRGGGETAAGVAHDPMGPMGVKTVDFSKLTRAIHETTPYKSVTGTGPGSFGQAVRQGVDTGNPTLEAQFTQGFLEKALLDAGFTPEAAQRALSRVDPGIVDQALVATGQDITPATRSAAAQNIGQMLAAKGAQETAAASPEVVAAAEQNIVGKLAKVVQAATPETHPVTAISSLADLAEEVAVQAAEMPTLFGTEFGGGVVAPRVSAGVVTRNPSMAEVLAGQEARTFERRVGGRGQLQLPAGGDSRFYTSTNEQLAAQAKNEAALARSRSRLLATIEKDRARKAAPPRVIEIPGESNQPALKDFWTKSASEWNPGGSGGGPIPPSVGPSIAPKGPTLGERIAAAIKQLPNAFASSRNIASFDDSALTSQLSPFIGAHPRAWAKGAVQGLGGFYNRAGVFEDAMASLTRRVEQMGISVGDSGLFLSQEGGGIVRGESQTAGYKWLRDTVAKLWNVPVVGAGARVYEQGLARSERAMLWTLNATRVQSLESAVKLSEWAYRRPMTIPETQGIARSINIASGRGIDFSKMDPNGKVAALAQVGNGLFFSMQMQVARARLIPEVARAGARTAWNAAHGAAPLPGDIEMLRLGAGQTAFLAAQVAFLSGAGLKMVSDMNNTNFGKVDLGPTGYPGMDKAVALAELVGMRTQSYNGRVYLDLGQTMGGDMKLLTQMVGPFFGTNPTDANGKQWNPWKATGTEKTPWDLMGNWASNKLVPALSMITSRLQNRPIDMGDPTQNPATALIMPLVASSAIQASGASDPGGSLYMPQFSNLSPSDVEKNKLRDTIATVPGLTTLSGQRQQQFDDRVTQAVKSTLDAVVASPEYQAKTPEEKKANLDAVTQTVGRDTRRAFAIQVAKTGGPDEVVPALAIALAASTTNLAKGSTLASVVNAGRLTPDLASQVDALRNQTDRGKPNYDPSVQELLQGRDLTAKWLSSPEFVVGNKADWDAAYLAATRLNALRAEDERRGVKPNEDTQLIDFYAQAANGALATYYTMGGSKRTQLVSPQRQEIQSSPLWSMFETAANRAEHPKAP